MEYRYALAALLLSPALGSSACAMEKDETVTLGDCSVAGEASLVKHAGGGDAVCSEIRRALSRHASADGAVVTVQIRRTHMMATVTMRDGRTLADIGFAISDSDVSTASLTTFAEHIAAVVGNADS